MPHTAIRAENLGKAYRLGSPEKRPESLAQAVGGLVTAPARNFRRLRRLDTFSGDREGQDVLWAVRDVSFEIGEGEVVGFVGRNGAGKSTLLKIFSRITEPTEGRVALRGRISSLLEVGTGFHAELTGRENVYMNGTILGMKKREIDAKFDQIVDFSGVERFLDTPIKRYSSGMKVRLAFSVAAHLEPEILIIDEVLAVGDADFQRKCLGKMHEVAGSGRTVLFVSHNMAAIQSLCTRALALVGGRVVEDGDAADVVRNYLASMRPEGDHGFSADNPHRRTKGPVALTDGRLRDGRGTPTRVVAAGEEMTLELDYEGGRAGTGIDAVVWIRNQSGLAVLCLKPRFAGVRLTAGATGTLRCTIPRLPLPVGEYGIEVAILFDGLQSDHIPNAMYFTVDFSRFHASGRAPGTREAAALVDQSWEATEGGRAMVAGPDRLEAVP